MKGETPKRVPGRLIIGITVANSGTHVTGPRTEFGSAPAHGYFVIATVKATAASGGQLDINPLDFYAKAGAAPLATHRYYLGFR